MAKILLMHGPNLNLLGTREPEIYGADTLESINLKLIGQAEQQGHQLSTTQSNAEHDLIQHIHDAADNNVSFIIFNPGGFTHTSVSLRDALLGVAIPFIEVHLSNVQAREEFRHHSYFSDIAIGALSGLGVKGYLLAAEFAVDYIEQKGKINSGI